MQGVCYVSFMVADLSEPKLTKQFQRAQIFEHWMT